MTFCLHKEAMLGIDISVVDQPELMSAIEGLVEGRMPALVNNVNIHACNLAYDQPEFRGILNRSEIVFCDGYGVKLGALLSGIRLGQRMTPPDWIDDLFTLCVCNGYGVYFLGDEEDVVMQFVEAVQSNHPDLRIAGWHNGFFDMHGVDNDRIIGAIEECGADIVITGMGMPRQELWAWEAKSRLSKGVIIATGALFRWYTGYEKRAPKWMTDFGLEWLARLFSNPVRHFRRYVVGIPLFYGRLLFGRKK